MTRILPKTLDDLVSRLDTEQGRALVSDMAAKLRPRLNALPDPPDSTQAPVDAFERALWNEASMDWVLQHRATAAMPGLVRAVLGRFTDSAQIVDLDQVRQTLGPQAIAFVERLLDAPEAPGRMTDRLALDSFSRSDTIAAVKREPTVAPEMETLDRMATMVEAAGAFNGFKFFGLQHLFMSSVTLFDKLHECGIAYEDMRLHGKIYSTSFRAATECEARGAAVSGSSRRLTSSFEKSMAHDIELSLRNLIGKLPSQPDPHAKPCILLIDDGAEAIEMLHQKFPSYAHYFVCVEQTRRGARKLKELDLKCAVVNVAETWAKLVAESPMIGHSVALEVKHKLDSLKMAGVKPPDASTVIGFGAVGQAVARSLRERDPDKPVIVWDKSPERRAEAAALGYVVRESLQDSLKDGHVVVSCVGERTLDADDLAALPEGAVLFNAASADDELGPENLRPYTDSKNNDTDEHGRVWATFQGKPICLGLAEAAAHCDRTVRLPNGRTLLVVNDGFVCNMTGERDPIPARYIQLTRTLLFLGAVFGVRQDGKPGLYDLPMDQQQATVNLTELQLKRTGESLFTPSWDERDGLPAIETMARPPLPPPSTPTLVGEDDDRETSNNKGERTYGYKLGAVKVRSFEAAVSYATGGDGKTLELPAAALHAAARAINETFQQQLHPQFKPSVETPLLASEPGRIEAADDEAAFETLYARYAVDLLRVVLTRQNRVPPSAAQLAAALAKLERIPVEALARGLRQSNRPGEVELALQLNALT